MRCSPGVLPSPGAVSSPKRSRPDATHGVNPHESSVNTAANVTLGYASGMPVAVVAVALSQNVHVAFVDVGVDNVNGNINHTQDASGKKGPTYQ